MRSVQEKNNNHFAARRKVSMISQKIIKQNKTKLFMVIFGTKRFQFYPLQDALIQELVQLIVCIFFTLHSQSMILNIPLHQNAS